MSQEQTESRNCGLSDRQIESALSRLLNGEPNTHEQTQAIVEMALRSLRSETGSRWVSTADRQPDKDGRLWAILVERRENGKHTGYIPLFEYYHFIDGWATDDGVRFWLEADLHPLPGVPK